MNSSARLRLPTSTMPRVTNSLYHHTRRSQLLTSKMPWVKTLCITIRGEANSPHKQCQESPTLFITIRGEANSPHKQCWESPTLCITIRGEANSSHQQCRESPTLCIRYAEKPTPYINNAGSHQLFVPWYAEKPTPHINNAKSHQLFVSDMRRSQLPTSTMPGVTNSLYPICREANSPHQQCRESPTLCIPYAEKPTPYINNAGSHQLFVPWYAEKPTSQINNARSYQHIVSRYT